VTYLTSFSPLVSDFTCSSSNYRELYERDAKRRLSFSRFSLRESSSSRGISCGEGREREKWLADARIICRIVNALRSRDVSSSIRCPRPCVRAMLIRFIIHDSSARHAGNPRILRRDIYHRECRIAAYIMHAARK